ncbi:MAG: hypothetical protein K0R28_1824 [Paenibacillus sp.]|jgi:hypothetical protein|nr:hypothetical protein [Paenibacillus sp.]
MDVIIFLFFSMLEWFALILLTFALFRLEIRDHIGQLLFASFLLSLFSFMLFIVFELTLFATLIQPIVVFLFFWLLFKIPVFYAGLIVVNGYLAYLLINSIIYQVIGYIGVESYPGTPITYLIQFIAGILVFILTWSIHKLRIGYSFVQYGNSTNSKGINRKLLQMTILGYVALASNNMLYFGAHKPLLVLVSMAVAFALLQFWTLKKEHEAAFWRRNRKYNIDA